MDASANKKIIYLSPDVADISQNEEPVSTAEPVMEGGKSKKVVRDQVSDMAKTIVSDPVLAAPSAMSVLLVDKQCEAIESSDDNDSEGSMNTQELMSLHPHYMMLESFFKVDEQTCAQMLKRLVLQIQELSTHVKELKDVIRDLKKK